MVTTSAPMVEWVSENEQIPGSIPEPEMLDSAGGGRIALHCLGGEGPPALFVHATGFNLSHIHI